MRILACVADEPLSREVLPAVAKLAAGTDCEVEILRVVEEVHGRSDMDDRRISVGEDRRRGIADAHTPGVDSPAYDMEGRVMPPPAGGRPAPRQSDEIDAREKDDMQARNSALAHRDLANLAGEYGINAYTIVRFGDPAEEIVAQAKESKADVIAMTTHARGALREAIQGSTAKDVLQRSGLPVLLVRPNGRS